MGALIHPLFHWLKAAAPLMENATPASHNGSQSSIGWAEVKGAGITPWRACPTKGAVTRQTHHMLPNQPQVSTPPVQRC